MRRPNADLLQKFPRNLSLYLPDAPTDATIQSDNGVMKSITGGNRCSENS
jgi:hypothetical protein